MRKVLTRRSQKFTITEYFSDEVDLPSKIELIDGVIGPFSDDAKLALLRNWGADTVIRLTGPDIWLKTIAALDGSK
jgi:hypothetical protein